MSTAADFFGGNAKSASFDGQPGIKWFGIVDRIGAPIQATEYVRPGSGLIGKPQFYPSGDPVMQLPITLLTDVRDPSIPSDDGRRTIYFEGEKRKALKTALRQVGAREPILGDWMSLEYYADQQGQGANPKKLYRSEYAINPDNSKRGAGYFPPDADPAAVAQTVAPVVPQAQTVPAYAPGQPNFGSPAQPAAVGWTEQNQPGQYQPFQAAPAAESPANNWPPAGSAPAAAAAPVQETQPQPVAAGSGPVAMNRPWG
jgi:hypothetical protein